MSTIRASQNQTGADSMGSSRAELEDLLSGSWQVGWLASIDCGDGWNQLIADFHHAAKKIDPDYRLCQVKEKFGGLRIYYDAVSGSTEIALRNLAQIAERKSYSICEVTGASGCLMRKQGLFKTLSPEYSAEGWIPV